MAKRYLETLAGQPAEATAEHLAGYAQARQHLGPALVVCNHPDQLADQVKRHWHRLTRTLQRQRAATDDVLRLLRYTYTITHMQHMQFVAGSWEDRPDASLLFTNDPAAVPAASVYTAYLTARLEPAQAAQAAERVCGGGLVVSYGTDFSQTGLMLLERDGLEATVAERWQQLLDHLRNGVVEPRQLQHPTPAWMDTAVDHLLEDADEFLRLAGAFARALELARPLQTTPQPMRAQYEAMLTLAQRVNVFLSPGFNDTFLKVYADDTRTLHDARQPERPRQEVARAFEGLVRVLQPGLVTQLLPI